MSIAALCTMAYSATGAANIGAFRAEIESNSVDRTTRCKYYRSWYAEQCAKAEHDAILERNLAAHGKWLAVRPFEISVPVDVMSRSNTFTIRNAFPPPETRRIPAIHYVVIRK